MARRGSLENLTNVETAVAAVTVIVAIGVLALAFDTAKACFKSVTE
jgi:hypothetical protein